MGQKVLILSVGDWGDNALGAGVSLGESGRRTSVSKSKGPGVSSAVQGSAGRPGSWEGGAGGTSCSSGGYSLTPAVCQARETALSQVVSTLPCELQG